MGDVTVKYEPGKRGRYPHGNTVVLFEEIDQCGCGFSFGQHGMDFIAAGCPNCLQIVTSMARWKGDWNQRQALGTAVVWPRALDVSISSEVPAHGVADLRETAAVREC